MNRRFLAVAISVALAVLGIVLVLAYVHSEAANVADGQQAVRVLAARETVPAGTSLGTALTDNLLHHVLYPRASLPVGYVSSPTHQEFTEVFTSALQPAQVVVAGDFGPRSQAASPLVPPTGDFVEMGLPVCQFAAVSGYIAPGSRVAVYDTTGTSQPMQSSCESRQAVGGGTTETVIATNIEVLSVQGAPPPDSSSGTAISPGGAQSDCSTASQGEMCVTVAVPTKDSLELADVAATGDLTLVLLTGQATAPPPGTTYKSKS